MASVSVWLNDKYKKQDGTCAVYVVTHVHRQKVKFNTGISVRPELWNDEKKRVKGSSKKAKDDNLVIDNCRARVNNVFVRYRLQNKELTPELLREEYKTPTSYIDFYDFYERKLNDQKGLLADNSVKQHKTVLNNLKKYKKSLMFSQITTKWIEDYQKYMKNKRKNSANTIRKHLGIIKGYLTIAVKEEIITKHPFNGIQIKGSQTERMYLLPNELQTILDLYRKGRYSENQTKVVRQYLWSCFTGQRISDVKVVSHDHIIGDKLVYKPVKQKSKLIRLKLIPAAKELIKDAGEHKIQGKIFDCYSDQVTNRILKNAIKGSGIDKDVSFHSGRHTFATNFLRKTKNIGALQKLLGHSNIRDTMIYAHVLQEDVDTEMDLFGEDF
ncbi:MAG: phage integrase SAM-like domain-containing protein [Bacteroidota bacterium]